MINKNLKNIRAKLRSACSSNNQSFENDNNNFNNLDLEKIKTLKINSDNIKTTEKSLDGEISFNITPDEDDIKRDLNKINNKRPLNKINKNIISNYGNPIPLDNKNNECIFYFIK